MEINQFQGITLYAFFEAVAQQTNPLPEDLKQQMSEIGDIFSKDTDTDIDRAINQLADLAQHPRLQPLYLQIRKENQPDYEPEELSKYTKFTQDPEKELATLPLSIINNSMITLQSPTIEQASQTSQELANFLKISKNKQ